MINIKYPDYGFSVRDFGQKKQIFDILRKKWLILTPEEWVRQHFIRLLINEYHYPTAFIAVEKQIKIGELNKRFDILVFDKEQQPFMMVECKAMEVNLTKEVFEQVLRYHIAVQVPYLVVTNGSNCMVWKKEGTQLFEIDFIPALT